jgi:ethanolamine utilization protein EutP (predicted NTPase)
LVFFCEKKILFMKKYLNMKYPLLVSMTIWLALIVLAPPALADNAVKLKILVISTGDIAEDLGLAYIKPVLEEMGVQYHVLNADTQDLTAAMLAHFRRRRLQSGGCGLSRQL